VVHGRDEPPAGALSARRVALFQPAAVDVLDSDPHRDTALARLTERIRVGTDVLLGQAVDVVVGAVVGERRRQ
jgi:hypothetical protein